MSYILDALKKADTERERGATPGLHTRHQIPSGGPANSATRRPLGLVLAGGLALLLLAASFWLWRAPGDPPPVLELAAVQPLPSPITPAETINASPPPVAPPPLMPPPDTLTEAPKARPKPVATPALAKAAATPSSTPATPAQAAVSVPAATAPAAAPPLAELPQDLRSQIPKIVITGSVYSASPAQRLLLVNNLVLAQGAQVAPDLTLEDIQPRSSVLNFKGTRFRVMH